MKKLTLVLLLATTLCYAQSEEEKMYNWDYVSSFVKKSSSLTASTKKIISTIAEKHDGEEEQTEMIRFYKESFDYKIVDKEILVNLIDSLAEVGLTDKIKATAIDAKKAVEYRLLNKKIRDFEFPDKNNKRIRLSSLNSKIVIVELWTTWCGPCLAEMTRIPELRKANPNIEFYSISLDKSADKMKRHLKKTTYDWPIVFAGENDVNPEFWEYLNIVAIPKYYTINRDGIIINISDKLDESFIKDLK